MIVRESELFKQFLHKKLKRGDKLSQFDIKKLQNITKEELDYRAKMLNEYQGNEAKIYNKKGANALKVCTKLSFNYK